MTNADIALARRFWMHVHEGGTLTTLDVGRMVTAMEEQDAAFTNLHREYDRRGDRIEAQAAEIERLNTQCEGLFQAAMNNGQALIIAEAKLAKAVEEAEKYRRAFAVQSRKLQAVLYIEGVRTTLAELKGQDDE